MDVLHPPTAFDDEVDELSRPAGNDTNERQRGEVVEMPPDTGTRETVVLCVDGSDASVDAVRTGFALLPQTARVVIVTVVERDETLVTGTGGHAGGVMSDEEFAQHEQALDSEGRGVLERAAAAMQVPAPETRVIRGEPGRALCDLATELPAAALVLGTRGRGGLKRAFLGSVSDYVVRNAPCPVVITSASS